MDLVFIDCLSYIFVLLDVHVFVVCIYIYVNICVCEPTLLILQ